MALNRFISVLVVDADTARIENVRALLRRIGFANIDHAHDGVQALSKMRAKRYELVVAEWASETAATHRVPLVAIGESKLENVIAAKKAGVSYLVRPFNAEALEAKIRTALAARTRSGPARQHNSLSNSQTPGLGKDESPATATPTNTPSRFPGVFTSKL
jgi:two-component system, chemotaxis family, chemotaxis protein CheY